MKIVALIVEITGVVAVAAAFVLEIIQKANIYLVIATGGSFLIAFGALLWAKVYKR
jgi:hypothetical protein